MTTRAQRRALTAVHGVSLRSAAVLAAAWLAVSVLNAVTIPLAYPYQATSEMVTDGVILGLVVPIVVAARILDEGPAFLVSTASRSLTAVRLAAAGAFLAVAMLGAALLAVGVDLPTLLVMADALLLAATTIASTALWGTRLSWILPLAVAMVFSAPGVVPFQANVLYYLPLARTTLLIALTATLVATVLYALRGGIHGRVDPGGETLDA